MLGGGAMARTKSARCGGGPLPCLSCACVRERSHKTHKARARAEQKRRAGGVEQGNKKNGLTLPHPLFPPPPPHHKPPPPPRTIMAKGAMDEAAMRKAIVAIMLDTTLSEPEKALKRQALMAGKWAPPAAAPAAGERERERERERESMGGGRGGRGRDTAAGGGTVAESFGPGDRRRPPRRCPPSPHRALCPSSAHEPDVLVIVAAVRGRTGASACRGGRRARVFFSIRIWADHRSPPASTHHHAHAFPLSPPSPSPLISPRRQGQGQGRQRRRRRARTRRCGRPGGHHVRRDAQVRGVHGAVRASGDGERMRERRGRGGRTGGPGVFPC